ncbi:hypothetical protein [uncultured Thiodictyon sp.]|uniref:hypothetical protein n=1 Tax=uncultured Thiodictyon sp. TaxID=1846217 RepID=UPI0025FDADF7|nr:hypothetical protein [uncultured Thiodictyon sp.]
MTLRDIRVTGGKTTRRGDRPLSCGLICRCRLRRRQTIDGSPNQNRNRDSLPCGTLLQGLCLGFGELNLHSDHRDTTISG